MAIGSSNPTVDIKRIGGTDISKNAGNSDAGTQRVVIATDQGAVRSNTTHVNGNAVSTGTGTPDTGTQRVAIATQTLSVAQTLGTAATRWFTQLTDGANNVGIKAGSTAAVAADPSLVVALSPNTALPAGSASIGNVGLNAGSNTIGNINNLAQLGGTNIVNGGTAGTLGVGGIQDHAAAISGNRPVLIGGFASSTAPTAVANGQMARMWLTSNGAVNIAHVPMDTQAYAPLNTTTTAYVNNLTVKGTSGTLYMVTGYSSRTSAQFIQIHDAASDTALATATIRVIFNVPPQSNFSFDLGPYGRFFTNGIKICNSTVGPTYTAGSADCWFDCQYV
jgi:hypothetical protein